MTSEKPALNPQTWLEQHGDYLFGYAMLKIKDTHIAEDLVQETLLAAIAAKDSFAGQSSVRTWLIGILKHKIIDHFRRQNRTIAIDDWVENDELASLDRFFNANGHWIQKPAAFPDPESAFQHNEFWHVFQQCLAGLKPKQAEVFVSKAFYGLSNDEICKHLSITSTNCWVLMHRARLSLIQCLKKNWID